MKFTHEKPTVPGWYIHRYHKDEMAVKIISVKGELCGEVCPVANMGGEWSERLVPVGTLQRALPFLEDEYYPSCATPEFSALISEVRRVVEGKEEV